MQYVVSITTISEDGQSNTLGDTLVLSEQQSANVEEVGKLVNVLARRAAEEADHSAHSRSPEGTHLDE